MAPYESQKTLLKLFQEEKYDYIYIPRIQRDYAQGRDNEEAAVIRENILDDVAEMRPLSWGIVFGVSEDRDWEDGSKKKCFIPVDGQQRLTTLYLLNLYGKNAIMSSLDTYRDSTMKPETLPGTLLLLL